MWEVKKVKVKIMDFIMSRGEKLSREKGRAKIAEV
jgi:hypothetical protein